MSRTFTITFSVPDEMTVDDLARSLGYVREHFTDGLTDVQRATHRPPNTTGTVWAGHGGILGTFTLADRKSDAPEDDADGDAEAARNLHATMQQLVEGLDKARDATRGVIEALAEVIAAEDETPLCSVCNHPRKGHNVGRPIGWHRFKAAKRAPYAGPRFVGEHVDVTRDCEIGRVGERAEVTEIDTSGRYPTMTLTFVDGRQIHTGADYRFLRRVPRTIEEMSARVDKENADLVCRTCGGDPNGDVGNELTCRCAGSLSLTRKGRPS